MLDQLEQGRSVTVAVPTEDQPWEVMHIDAGYLVHAPVFVPQGEERAPLLRGCLSANGAPAMNGAAARLVFRNPHVNLEALLPPSAIPEQLQDLLPLVQAVREAAISAEHQPAEAAELEAEDARQSGDPSLHTVALLKALDRLAQTDVDLSEALSVDLIRGEAHFEGDDGSWVVAVGAGPDTDDLELSASVCALPDGEGAADLIAAALALGSVRAMGEHFRLVCDPACTLMLVSTHFQPHTGTVDDLKAAIGGLLMLAERTAAKLPAEAPSFSASGSTMSVQSPGAAGPSDLAAPPSKDDSLAFYARISA